MNTVYSIAVASLLSVALSVGASALGADQSDSADEGGDGMALLRDYLDKVDTLTARFEQSLVDANDLLIESSSGAVQIRQPGQFRWTYETPYAQELVADGQNVWSYDVDLDQVTVKPQAEMLANTPATLLSGNRDVLDEFRFISATTDSRDTVWLTLEPVNADNGFKRVELGFDDGILQRMIFADSLDQTTLVAFVDVTLNEPVPEDAFEFQVPDGVDLVGEPLAAERVR